MGWPEAIMINSDLSEPLNVKIDEANEKLDKLSSVLLPVGTWGDMADSELYSLMKAVDSGNISLTSDCGWTAGDERQVTLTNGETITLILSDPGHYELATATASGRTTCNFTLIMKQCLNTTYAMNSSATNAGSWESSAMKSGLNSTYLYNLLPDGLKSILKSFKVKTAQSYSGSTIQTSTQKLALFAEKEVLGTRTYSNATEANALTQLDYFKTSSNRVKQVNGSNSTWWLRSPYSTDAAAFCRVADNGSADYHYAANTRGVCAFGCI